MSRTHATVPPGTHLLLHQTEAGIYQRRRTSEFCRNSLRRIPVQGFVSSSPDLSVRLLSRLLRSVLWSVFGRRNVLLRRDAVIQSLPFRHEQGAVRRLEIGYGQHASADCIEEEYARALLGVSIVAQVRRSISAPLPLPPRLPRTIIRRQYLVRRTDSLTTELRRSLMRTISIVDGPSPTPISRLTTNG